jgi:hypothetical protein
MQTSKKGRSKVRVHLSGRTVQDQYSEVRIRLQDSPVQKTDTVNRQNTVGERITKMKPGAGIQGKGDKVSSLCDVINNCSSTR